MKKSYFLLALALTTTSVLHAENSPVRLTASEIRDLYGFVTSGSFGATIRTTQGKWFCTTGIAQKVCSFPRSESQTVDLSGPEIAKLKDAVSSSAYGMQVKTSAGVWECTNDFVGGKSCSLAN